MSKKYASKVVLLAFVASFFAVPHLVNAGTTPTTTTSITNIAPVFSVHATESWVQAYAGTGTTDARAESSATYPTNAGTAVRFTATATDANSDAYYLAVCKTNAITPGTNAAPTCASVPNTWAISSSETASGVSTFVEYTTLVGDVESNNWYAFVCDKISGGPGLCSAVSNTSQGGINDEVGSGGTPTPAGSPFRVNHRPTFGTAAFTGSGDSTIYPNETLTTTLPNAQIDDADLNGSQDTVTLYVCSGEATMGGATSAFDFRANTCTGGTLLCTHSGVNPTTTDATCNDTTSSIAAPTAHASFNVKIFMEDAHSFDDNTGTSTQAFTVSDAMPTWVSYTATDNPAPAAGGSDLVDFSVSISDLNGDNDVTGVGGFFFDDDVINLSSGACTPDHNNCYQDTVCDLGAQSALGTGKTAMGADTGYTAACQVTVYFNANASGNWEVHTNPTDSTNLVTTFVDSNADRTNAALSAINVTEGTIAYGTIALGGTSSGQTTTQQNYGNQVLDVLIEGTDMTGTPSGTIQSEQQKWHNTVLDFTYASAGNALVNSAAGATTKAAGCADRNLAVRDVQNGTAEDEPMYWKIQIPAAQTAGSYTGTNTFAATASTTCTDGE